MENTLLQNTLTEEREGFKIENLEGATWAFRKLRAIESKEDEIKDTAQKEIEVITSWRDKELEQYAKDKEYFNYLLEEYYRAEKAKDKKFKLSTPYGKVTSRTENKFIYDSEEEIINYCDENNLEVVKTKKTLDKTTFKKLCPNGVNEETGEVIPGLRIEENVTSVSIKVSK